MKSVYVCRISIKNQGSVFKSFNCIQLFKSWQILDYSKRKYENARRQQKLIGAPDNVEHHKGHAKMTSEHFDDGIFYRVHKLPEEWVQSRSNLHDGFYEWLLSWITESQPNFHNLLKSLFSYIIVYVWCLNMMAPILNNKQ